MAAFGASDDDWGAMSVSEGEEEGSFREDNMVQPAFAQVQLRPVPNSRPSASRDWQEAKLPPPSHTEDRRSVSGRGRDRRSASGQRNFQAAAPLNSREGSRSSSTPPAKGRPRGGRGQGRNFAAAHAEGQVVPRTPLSNRVVSQSSQRRLHGQELSEDEVLADDREKEVAALRIQAVHRGRMGRRKVDGMREDAASRANGAAVASFSARSQIRKIATQCFSCWSHLVFRERVVALHESSKAIEFLARCGPIQLRHCFLWWARWHNQLRGMRRKERSLLARELQARERLHRNNVENTWGPPYIFVQWARFVVRERKHRNEAFFRRQYLKALHDMCVSNKARAMVHRALMLWMYNVESRKWHKALAKRRHCGPGKLCVPVSHGVKMANSHGLLSAQGCNPPGYSPAHARRSRHLRRMARLFKSNMEFMEARVAFHAWCSQKRDENKEVQHLKAMMRWRYGARLCRRCIVGWDHVMEMRDPVRLEQRTRGKRFLRLWHQPSKQREKRADRLFKGHVAKNKQHAFVGLKSWWALRRNKDEFTTCVERSFTVWTGAVAISRLARVQRWRVCRASVRQSFTEWRFRADTMLTCQKRFFNVWAAEVAPGPDGEKRKTSLAPRGSERLPKRSERPAKPQKRFRNDRRDLDGRTPSPGPRFRAGAPAAGGGVRARTPPQRAPPRTPPMASPQRSQQRPASPPRVPQRPASPQQGRTPLSAGGGSQTPSRPRIKWTARPKGAGA